MALLGVRPQQVAKETVFRHLSWPSDLLELADSDELGREATMHAQNFIINKCGNRHTVKNVLELLPKSDGVPVLALVVEAVDSIDLTALVISAQQEEVFLELDLVGEQKNYGFE